MRNNKMKGFTLVELLVVIAILAILATVSVVGYTSYIESTNITVDENLAAQLNRFLEAYKVNFTGDIDENNIREVTLEILKEGGLEGQLIAKSKDRDFYFDLKDGKYVLRTDEESGILTPGYKVFFGLDTLAADGSEYEVKIENCFTPDHRYFYVGSASEDAPISLIIDAFYKFNPDPANHKDLVSKINNLGISDLSTFVENAVVVTDECNYRLGENQTNVIFADGVNMIGTVTKAWNGTDWTPVTGEYVLATLAGKLTIPGSVKFFAEDALNLGAAGTIVINKTARDVAYMSNANFANDNVTFKLNDGEFKTADSGTGENEGKPVVTNGTVEYLIQYSNPMVSFSGTLSADSPNKVKDVTSDAGTFAGFAAWDVDYFYINSTGFIGKDKSIPATQTGVTWSVAEKSKAYISFDENNPNKIVINHDAVRKVADMPETLTIIGTPTESSEAQSITFVIDTIYLKTTTCTIEGRDAIVNPNSTFLYGGDGNTSYELVKNVAPNKTEDGITLTHSISISNANFELNGSILTLAEGKEDTTTGLQPIEVIVNNYEYLNNTVNLTMFNANSLTFLQKNKNLVFVGDVNAIKASDLFVINGTQTIPDNAEIWIVPEMGESDFATLPAFKATDYTTDEDGIIPVDNANKDNWENLEIQFKGGANDFTSTNACEAVVIVVAPDHEGNYIRISANHPVTIVSGKNVDSFSDLQSDVNNVLISNISDVPTDYTGKTINRGKVLYGNGFAIDFKKYDDTKIDVVALITLDGAILNNIKVVGNVYASSEFNFQNPDDYDYGASLVYAKDGSKILDAYLAFTRSPLITDGEVTVHGSTGTGDKGTIIVGGNYANIDVRGGKLIVTGKVTTINQVIEGLTDSSLGAGIVVDLFADADTEIDISAATLKQFNYISQTDASLLPKVYLDLVIEDVTVEMKDKVGKFFKDSTLSQFLYTEYVNVDGETKEVKYFNSGIIFLNGVEIESYRKNWKGEWVSGGIDTILNLIGVPIVDSDGGVIKTSDAQNYDSKTLTEPRGPKEVNVVITTLKVSIYANAYFWIPMPDAIYEEDGTTLNANNTNNGIMFDNDVSDYIVTFN